MWNSLDLSPILENLSTPSRFHLDGTPIKWQATPISKPAVTTSELLHYYYERSLDTSRGQKDQAESRAIVLDLLSRNHHLQEKLQPRIFDLECQYYESKIMEYVLEGIISDYKQIAYQLLWKSILATLQKITGHLDKYTIALEKEAVNNTVAQVFSENDASMPYGMYIDLLQQRKVLQLSTLFAKKNTEELAHFEQHAENLKLSLAQRYLKIFNEVVKNATPNMTKEAVTEKIEEAIKRECQSYYAAIRAYNYIPETNESRDPTIRDRFDRSEMNIALAAIWLIEGDTYYNEFVDTLTSANDQTLSKLKQQIAQKNKELSEQQSRLLLAPKKISIETRIQNSIQEQCNFFKGDATRFGQDRNHPITNAENLARYLQNSTKLSELQKEVKNAKNIQKIESLWEKAHHASNTLFEEKTLTQDPILLEEEKRVKLAQDFYHATPFKVANASLLEALDQQATGLRTSARKRLSENSRFSRLHNEKERLANEPIDCMWTDKYEEKTLLDKALRKKDLEIAIAVLNDAHRSEHLIELLHATLIKIKDSGDKEDLMFLIKTTYLWSPEKNNLFNVDFVKKIRQQKPIAMDNYISSLTYDNSDEKSTSDFSSLFDEHHKPRLAPEEINAMNKAMLQEADEHLLAHFIHKVGGEKPAYYSPSATQVREELRRRYVETGAIPSEEVCVALNKNLAIAERADRLAVFYDKETRHICQVYQKNETLYTKKADIILKKYTESAKSLDTLEREAFNIATNFSLPRSYLNERRSGCVSDPHTLSKVQRLFDDAYTLFPSVNRPIERTWVKLSNSLPFSARQNDTSVLNREIATVDQRLHESLLNRIPLSYEEKDACVKRAALARGAFKKTLEYLDHRKYGNDKKEVMETYLQQYINGRNKENKPYSAQDLIKDLEEAKGETGELGKKVGFWASNTSHKLTKDLKKHQAALLDFSPSTALAAG